MSRVPTRLVAQISVALVLVALVAGGWVAYREYSKDCCAFPDEPEPPPVMRAGLTDGPPPRLGLMTSLPLYWPLGAEFGDLANGNGGVPWQREALGAGHELVPLDTLSPIPGLSPDEPETDPLKGLDRLAVIQPRGLSPADNVALDDWVKGGGQVLLVLDPLLTGEYDLPLGDPRRPADTALIPPVLERWGLDIKASVYEYWEAGVFEVPFWGRTLTVSHPGQIEVVDPDAASCELHARNVIARCDIGDGGVTLVADAAMFEDAGADGENGRMVQQLMAFAFE